MAARLKRRGRIYYCWVPRPGGGTRRVSTNCTDRRAAELKAAELERHSLDPAHSAAYTTTVKDACDRFMKAKARRGRAAGTLHHYGVKLSHLATYFAGKRLVEITHGALEGYIDKRTADGAARTTVKKELRACGALLRYALRSGLWTGDVARVLPEYEDDYQPRETRLSAAEAGRLVASLMQPDNAQDEETAINRACCVAFIIATSARWAEVMRAELGDVDFVRGVVRLRGTKTKKARREVPMTPLTRDALALVGIEAERWGWTKGRLFRAWSNVVRDLEVACRQAGVPRVTPNDLRRTFGSWLRAAGAPLDAIAMAMGHVDSRMVERVYGRLSTAELGRLLGERLMDGDSEKPRGLLGPGDNSEGDDRAGN